MVEQAFNQRWPISNDYKDALVKTLTKIMVDPTSSKREQTAAARALIAAESQNQSDELCNGAADEQRNRFLDVAERLGLGGDLKTVSIESTNVDTTTIVDLEVNRFSSRFATPVDANEVTTGNGSEGGDVSEPKTT